MSMDSGEPGRPDWLDLARLPDILAVRLRRRAFDPPRRVTSKGVDREVTEAIEIEIRVSEPFVIRALGPVLWVGDEPLTVAETDADDVYRFLAFEPKALAPEAPIALSWGIDGSRKTTPHRFSLRGERRSEN